MARSGDQATAQVSAGTPAHCVPSRPLARTSPLRTHSTSSRAVMASDWKVFSRQRASVEPRLPASAAAATVTPTTRKTWPYEIPPNSVSSINSGTAARISTKTLSELAKSLPRTNSALVMRVIKSRSSVRRSFSWATAAVVSSAAKAMAMTICKGANRANTAEPKRERSPRLRISCEPSKISQAVNTNPNRAATYTARIR